MTAKLKMFHGSHLFIPRPWLEALGMPGHVRQCGVTVLAWAKSDIAAMLTDRDLSQGYADRLAGEMRMGKPAGPDVMLIDAGVIDMTAPGIYAYDGIVKDRPVIRVEPDGTPLVVAHFRMPERGGPLVVEKEG